MMGPGMAKAAAGLIVSDAAELDIAPYNPGRFSASGPAV